VPIVNATSWQQYTGQTLAGADLTACTAWCGAVSAAIERMLWPLVVEPVTRTDILDAPPHRDLVLRHRPVRSITELRYNAFADGVPSRFDPTTTLIAGEDYELVVDDPGAGLSRCGIVRRLGGRVWGVTRWGSPGTLAPRLHGIRGAVQVTADVGFPATPDDILAAAVMAVTLCFRRRALGTPTTSESWNGYSASWSPQLVATAAVQSPDVLALLQPYLTPRFA